MKKTLLVIDRPKGTDLFIFFLFLSFLVSLINNNTNHFFIIILYLILCVATLLSAFTQSLSNALSYLSIIIGYDAVAKFLIPNIMRDKVFISLFIILLSLVLCIRFLRRITSIGVSLSIAALYGFARYIYNPGSPTEFVAAAEFFSAAIIGMSLVSRPLQKYELLKIVSTLCMTLTALALLVMVKNINELGWVAFVVEVVVGPSRLGDLSGVSVGSNSIAYLFFVGVSCGYVLCAHQYNHKAAWLAIVICLLALFLTKSRGTIFPTLAFIWYYYLHKKNILYNLGSLLMIFVFLFIASSSEFILNFMRLTGEKEITLVNRAETWKVCYDLISQNILNGISYYDFFLYNIVQYSNADFSKIIIASTPHNILISYLLFYGIFIGGGLILISFIAFIRSVTVNVLYHEKLILLIPVFGFIIHMTVDQWYFIYLFFFSLVTMPFISNAHTVSDHRMPPFSRRGGLLKSVSVLRWRA